MLLKPYKNLKSQLSDIEGIKLIDWFNDQYAGTIHTEPAIFIEFPVALKFETKSKQIQQAPFVVRVHMVTKAIQKQDNSILESVIDSHFASCEAIYYKLQGYRYAENDKLIHNSLARTEFMHHQYMQGWMISTQDFECMLYQHEQVKEKTEMPNPVITIS
jgi:hypothetical protein